MIADIVINLVPSTLDATVTTAWFLTLIAVVICFVAQLIYRTTRNDYRIMENRNRYEYELKLAEITKKTPPDTKLMEDDVPPPDDTRTLP